MHFGEDFARSPRETAGRRGAAAQILPEVSGVGAPRDSERVSTRKLIVAALVCGVAILVAGALQFVQIAQGHH